MGKVASTICKIASPLVTLANPVVGIILSGTAAVSDIICADNERRRLNTQLDLEMEAERVNQLKAEELRLSKYLDEIQDLYNKNYGYLSESKEIMEEYCLTIHCKLNTEKVVIENLEEILELLHVCCTKEYQSYDYIVNKLNKYRNEIFVLLQWGLMHITLLSGEEVLYKKILELSNDVVNCLEIDHLGHSILEYAYLLGDQKLIHILQNNQVIFESLKLQNEAKLIIAKNKLTLNFANESQDSSLIKYIEDHNYELAKACITLGFIPQSIIEGEKLIKFLVSKEQNFLLEKILEKTHNYLSFSLINDLENLYLPPRNYNKEQSILKLKTFLWLKEHNFSSINAININTKETALETAINTGNQEDFINLLKCNANLHQINYRGDTLLMFAIKANNSSIVEYLIKKHEIDPRIYNFDLDNGILATSSINPKVQNLIIDISSHLILEEKQFFKSFNPQVSELIIDHVFVNILSQASNYYRLLQKGKRSTHQARLPIILGLYVLSIKQIMPLDESELPWIADKLGLRLNYNSKEYNFNDLNLPLVNIKKIPNGYSAVWDNNYLEILESEIQYMLPSGNYDLDLNFDEEHDVFVINIHNYIYNNYLMLENFQNTHVKQINHGSFRLDELSTKPNIVGKNFIDNDYNFLYYYDLPERDAGYQALGISRFRAAKLLIDNLDKEEILDCLKIEWVNWLASLSSLPEDINNIPNINYYIAKYKEAKKLWKDNHENLSLFQSMNFQFNSLYNLSTKDYCAIYIAKVILAPHNILNSLKYYPAMGGLPQGGVLVALAKIMKLNINIYKLQADNLENIFSLNIYGAIDTINILKYCFINNGLYKIAILSKNIRLHFKPVITHLDLFSSLNKNTDLGAIFHGWFNFLSEKSLIIPQNDILALLLSVKSKMLAPELEVNLLPKIRHFRSMLSQELSVLLGKQFKEFKKLDDYWVNVAEQKVRNVTREYLLKEHCKIVSSYQNQISLVKEILNVELDQKFLILNQEQEEFNKMFEEVKGSLNIWLANERQLAIEDSNQQKLKINDSINKYLSEKHNLIKKHSKKIIKNSIINFVVDYVFEKIPKFKNLTPNIIMKFSNVIAKSALKNESLNFKKITNVGISQILNVMPLNENLFETAIKGMTENFISGILYEKNHKDVIRTTILGGMQSVCNFGIDHHIKFSETYVKSIFAGSVDSLLEGIKKDNFNIENILIMAANKIASNIEKLEQHKANIIYHKNYSKKYIFYKEIDLHYFNITRYNEGHREYISNDFNGDHVEHTSHYFNENNLPNEANFNEYWEQSLLKQLANFKKQDIKEQYGLNESQILRRKKMPKLSLFFDEINKTEKDLNDILYKFKKNSINFLKNKNNKLKYDLISLDLSISKKILSHGKKLAVKTMLFTAERLLPASTSELRFTVLQAAMSSEVYFMYKLGEEFKIPGTNIRVALLGNRTQHPLGRWPHYHRRRVDPNNHNKSLDGQGMQRHRPWELPKNAKGEKLDCKFKDRF